MDKYVSRDLQEMVCKELEGIAKKKEIDTPATVELLKELTSSLKNLMKIEKLEKEKEEVMDGYSQRAMGRYYVDGTYGDRMPWDSYSYKSNVPGGRGMDYGYDSGNSYRYPRTYPIYMNDGYSRHGGDPEEMKHELRNLMNMTSDDSTKKAIMDMLSKMN